MKTGSVGAVVVGADRIAANGDTANKIGTYQIAVLAAAHGVPFLRCRAGFDFDLTISSATRFRLKSAHPRKYASVRSAHRADGRTWRIQRSTSRRRA